MAQTISELEKERAELLKAIETQAQTMSSTRGGGEDSPEHTLQDWLNAAEEVMPNNPRTRTSQSQQSTPASGKDNKANQTKNNRASFFGVIIMLALLLTILGVLYIAYTSIHNELKTVMANKVDAVKEIKELKASVEKLQTDVAASGKGQMFEDLQKRVALLEKELKSLQEKMSKQSVALVGTAQLPNNVVTTDVLDAKLKEYTKGIDAKLEKILKHLNLTMDDDDATPAKATDAETQSKVTVSKEEADEQVAEPKAPSVKPMDQPVVRLVQKAPEPKQPSAPEKPKAAAAPLKNYTQDVKWLMSQPAFNFTLQLASMGDRASIQKVVENKGLQGTKIIPQERNGEQNYVLLTGSYATRQQAENAASTYKSKFGISPWIRKIKDLSSRVK
jgi:hypothetical protein